MDAGLGVFFACFHVCDITSQRSLSILSPPSYVNGEREKKKTFAIFRINLKIKK